MAREITCPGCSQTFEAPERSEGRWLECPHCQERIVNLSALKSVESVWRGAVGVIFITMASCGALAWLMPFLRVIQDLLNNLAIPRGLELVEMVVIVSLILPCGLLFLSGMLFWRAGARPAGRAARTVGALAALAVSLLAATVLIFVINRLSRP
jgi:hypothetical protein